MHPGNLEVLLVGASGIKNTDIFDKLDSYAVISCGGHNFKSKIAKDQGTSPAWKEKFNIPIERGVDELIVEIYDEDSMTSDDFVGWSKIPLDKVFKEKKITSSYDVIGENGKKKGVVALSLTYEQNSNLVSAC